MKKNANWGIAVGFILILAGALTYVPVFVRFPVTRDFPWVNLLLCLVGGILIGRGLYRAFRQPRLYRGRVTGTVLAIVGLLIIGSFCFGVFVFSRRLPPPAAALHSGQTAPDFTLPDTDGNAVRLSAILRGNRAVLLVFYRGYW